MPPNVAARLAALVEPSGHSEVSSITSLDEQRTQNKVLLTLSVTCCW